MITVRDILNKYNTPKLDTHNITENFLNVHLTDGNYDINNLKKPSYKKEGERNCYIYKLDKFTFTIYDNPMRAVREFDSIADGHTYKTWNREGIPTLMD